MDALLPASVNFNAVRDGRRSPLFYYDVDLSTARSKAAGTALVLNLAGDAFFADKDPNFQGAATVYFQDTSLTGSAPAPVYMEPGAIMNVPFTQLLIENVAQAGKRLRFFYGVGVDFKPGTSSSVNVVGNVSIVDTVSTANQHQNFAGPTAIGTLVTPIILPAANLNGIIVKAFSLTVVSGGAGAACDAYLMAAATAPASGISKANAILIGFITATNGAQAREANFGLSRRLPSGWGIWRIDVASAAIGACIECLEYEVL